MSSLEREEAEKVPFSMPLASLASKGEEAPFFFLNGTKLRTIIKRTKFFLIILFVKSGLPLLRAKGLECQKNGLREREKGIECSTTQPPSVVSRSTSCGGKVLINERF